MPIFLIGFMGAGKTTLGRSLEARLPGWRFVDLDEEIERRVGQSVSEIFRQQGEAAFRLTERQVLEEFLTQERVIVSCGGGTPCFFDNMERMNAAGQTILLEASMPVLHRRLLEAQAQRPKLAGLTPAALKEYILHALSQRQPHYSRATHRFPTDHLESESEIEATCRLFISRFIPSL